MIFCGDFVYPFVDFKSSIFQLGEDVIKTPKLLNYESTLDYLNGNRGIFKTGLYSTKCSLNVLHFLKVKCVALANNHVTDFSFDATSFIMAFNEHCIETMGFGNTIKEAVDYWKYEEEKLIILNFGWEAIKCKAASFKGKGINPYRYTWVEILVRQVQDLYPNYKIVLFLHWNYEFENLPQPADRMFAHHMIDIGVDAIIGHHPHIINPLEIYRGKPIFYSLGNFYFPQVNYGNVKVSFRDSALLGISVDYKGDLESCKIYLHKQKADGSKLELMKVYDVEAWYNSSYNIPINLMSDEEYLEFYKSNHFHKRKLLPIYYDYRRTIQNSLFDKYVLFRQKFIDIIKR
ncbi:CapA family protein [Butyricimonas sp.]|uniref:CapA family protein n=1 Tax=Butyricimonas sp. TaxID=1969738 RepID=UPI00258645F1|nr:CapA family protein [Butyricimonas sp.]